MLTAGDNGPVESHVDARAREPARIVWDHLVLSGPLSQADVILALGCHDTRVEVHATRLWHEGWAPLQEETAANTGENITASRRLLRERGSR